MSGMPKGSVDIKKVEVGSHNDKPIYVRTVVCGDKMKPKLVILPGYGSSVALYFKLTKRLTQYFNVIYVDLVGMGASS